MTDTLDTIYHERVEYLGSNDKTKAGTSDKYYEIKVETDGTEYIETRNWGRYGAPTGQSKVIRHYARTMAIASAQKQLKKKMRKGYTKPTGALLRLAMEADNE